MSGQAALQQLQKFNLRYYPRAPRGVSPATIRNGLRLAERVQGQALRALRGLELTPPGLGIESAQDVQALVPSAAFL